MTNTLTTGDYTTVDNVHVIRPTASSKTRIISNCGVENRKDFTVTETLLCKIIIRNSDGSALIAQIGISQLAQQLNADVFIISQVFRVVFSTMYYVFLLFTTIHSQ